METLLNNKDWIFSGIGVFVLSSIVGIIIYFVRKKKRKNISEYREEDSSKRTINQYGEKSIYIEENKGDINVF